MRIKKLCFVGLLVLGFNNASAGVMYTDESAFLSAAGAGLDFESFESLTVTNTNSQNVISVTDFTVTDIASGLGVFDTDFTGGPQASDGQNYINWATNNNVEVQFTFNSGINAFGLTLIDALEQLPGFSLSLSTNNGESYPEFLTSPQGDELELFFGVVSDTLFTSATFTYVGTNELIGLDAVYSGLSEDGSGVPLPSTVSLIFAGVIGLGAFRRRRESNGN